MESLHKKIKKIFLVSPDVRLTSGEKNGLPSKKNKKNSSGKPLRQSTGE